MSAFPGGDGFIVRHVNTDELLEVSIFHDNQESEWVILAVLTIPSIQPDPKSGDDSALSSHSLSRKLVGGKWRRQNHSNAKIDETSGEGTDVDETTPVKDEKRVVGEFSMKQNVTCCLFLMISSHWYGNSCGPKYEFFQV